MKCDGFQKHCDSQDAERYKQNTNYVDEDRNWVTLCPNCRAENDEFWEEQWAEYYSGCM